MFGGVLGGLLGGALKGGISGFGPAMGAVRGGLGLKGRGRRKRRKTLSRGQINDMTMIAHTVGKTAAAEYIRGVLR